MPIPGRRFDPLRVPQPLGPVVCSPTPKGGVGDTGCDPCFVELKLQHLWLVAEVGRLRQAHAKTTTFNLPGGAGTNQFVLVAVNDGSYAKYVRCRARPGSGALTTFSGSSSSMDPGGAAFDNLGTVDFVEFILLPSERLVAQNQGAAAFDLVVYDIDIPIKIY